MKDSQKNRIVLLTRTGRPSGLAILSALLASDKNVVGVFAEKRSAIIRQKGFFRFVKDALVTHGVFLLCKKALELLAPAEKQNGPDLFSLCQKHEVELHITKDHNSKQTKAQIRALAPHILITANTRIIKKNLISIPGKLALNFHTSLLPQYAGLDSIFWALYHEEKQIGVTVHVLEPELDTGDIVCQKAIAIQPHDNVDSLTAKAIDLGGKLMVEAVTKIEENRVDAITQDLNKRSYFSWPKASQRRELATRLKKRKHL